MLRHVRNAAAAWAAAALCALALASAATADALAASATHTVVMEGVAFAPSVLTVAKGDSIVWVNKDPFPHTAVSKDAGLDSKEIGAGASWKFVAATKGEFPYICTLHPTMKGVLRVQ